MSMLTVCMCEVCLPFRFARPGTLLDSTAGFCPTLRPRLRHRHHPSTTALHITSIFLLAPIISGGDGQSLLNIRARSSLVLPFHFYNETLLFTIRLTPNNIDIATSINSSYSTPELQMEMYIHMS